MVNHTVRNLLDNVDTPVFGINSHGYIDVWNRKLEGITGYNKQEVLCDFLEARHGKTRIHIETSARISLQMYELPWLALVGWSIGSLCHHRLTCATFLEKVSFLVWTKFTGSTKGCQRRVTLTSQHSL